MRLHALSAPGEVAMFARTAALAVTLVTTRVRVLAQFEDVGRDRGDRHLSWV